MLSSKCVLPLDIQTHQTAVECYTLPMSDQFDLILGQDWSKPAGAVIPHRDDSIEILDLEARLHKLFAQSVDSGFLCPIVSAINLEKDLQPQDQMYLVQVTEADTHPSVTATASKPLPHDPALHSVLNKYMDCFPAQLPAKLPPERNVYHTIPLKYNEPPPPHKSYRLSKPELAELHKQTADLLKKGYIQPSNSPYGHPVLFIKKPYRRSAHVC